MLDYIWKALSLLWETPFAILFIGVLIAFFYCAAMVIVGVPTSIWEAITKKKAREDIEKKIIIAVTVLLIIAALILESYQKSH